MKHLCLFICLVCIIGLPVHAQISFANHNTLFPTWNLHSAMCVGVADLNGDRKDDVFRIAGGDTIFVEYQAVPNGPFTELWLQGQIAYPWSVCAGDVDNDGRNEIICGDDSYGVLLYSWNGNGYSRTDVSGLANAPNMMMPQGVNCADINGDSYLDIFMCNDVGRSHLFQGAGAVTSWSFNPAMIDLTTAPASDTSGNYASIWTDINADGYIDLLITKCRQGVTNPADGRRIDQVFISNGNGTYTQDVTNWTNLRDGAQGWSTASGDIDNDGDMDMFVLNYDVNARLMINNGTGVFTDAMATSGIVNTTTFFGQNTSFHDFDNDGFADLLIAGSEHFLYHNNGNGTFTQAANPFPDTINAPMPGYAVGDLNDDGKLDVLGTYTGWAWQGATADKLWLNTSANTNHYVVFDLVGGATSGMSNSNGIGAIVKIYGGWGVQVREVRSGEGYGIQNSFAVHFGLGTFTGIDSVVVIWPSGIVDRPVNNAVDGHVVVNEGSFPASTAAAYYHPFRLTFGPNPVGEQINVQLYNTDVYGLQNMTVEIFDLSGKIVYAKEGLESNSFVINRGGITTGMYLFNVRAGKKNIATEKLVVR